jgi:hypothetical protein
VFKTFKALMFEARKKAKRDMFDEVMEKHKAELNLTPADELNLGKAGASAFQMNDQPENAVAMADQPSHRHETPPVVPGAMVAPPAPAVQQAQPIASAKLQDQGERLLRLIQLEKDVQATVQKAKNDIAVFVKDNPLVLPDGTVSYARGYSSTVLNKDKLRDIIMRALKLDAARAQALISLALDTKQNNPYIKVVRKHIKAMQQPQPGAATT